MKCAHCGKQMVPARYEGVLIDLCSSDGGCGGTWLSSEELASLQSMDKHQPVSAAKVQAIKKAASESRRTKTHLPCPVCSTAMDVFQFASNTGVYIDKCPNLHGVWLERDELLALQHYVDESRKALRRNTGETAVSGVPEGERRCPRDGSALSLVEYEGQSLEQCGQCHGFWCDGDELREIVHNTEKKFNPADHPEISAKETAAKVKSEQDLGADLCCIVCHQPMRRLNYAYTSGVVIDRCTKGHGVWLDRDEIEKIQLFIEHSKAIEHETKAKFAPLLHQTATQASASYDAATKPTRKNGMKKSPLFGMLASVFQPK